MFHLDRTQFPYSSNEITLAEHTSEKKRKTLTTLSSLSHAVQEAEGERKANRWSGERGKINCQK